MTSPVTERLPITEYKPVEPGVASVPFNDTILYFGIYGVKDTAEAMIEQLKKNDL